MTNYYDKLKNELIPYDLGFTKIRIGPNCDGGYVIYKEPLGETDIVYSFGIGPICVCDTQLANMGKLVRMYDSKPFIHKTHPNFRFKQMFVTSETINEELDSISDNNLLMCMDIEGGEYEVFSNIKEENLLKFSQISIEIHWIGGEYRVLPPGKGAYGRPPEGDEVINLFKTLNKNFVLFHIHENNGANPVDEFPDVIECSYLRRDLCDKIEKETKSYPLPGLDYPNWNNNVKIDLNWWL